jgi:hypothetical protein
MLMPSTPPTSRAYRSPRLSVRTLVGTVGRATTGVVTTIEIVRHLVRPGPRATE